MFNKFKKGQKVYIYGFGKDKEQIYNTIGKVVEKDDFFCDYLVVFTDGTYDWFDEKSIQKYIKKRRNNNENFIIKN